jgi:RHS repeat-associated protein
MKLLAILPGRVHRFSTDRADWCGVRRRRRALTLAGTGAGATVSRRYQYGPTGEVLYDQPFFTAGATTYAFGNSLPLGDHQHSTRLVLKEGFIDPELTVGQSIDYAPFGAVAADRDANGDLTTAALDAVFAHHGSLLDRGTGLQLKGARWYAPDLGRFVSTDPSGYAGGDANLYRAFGNDPVNSADPTGLSQSGHPLAGGYGSNKTTKSLIPGGTLAGPQVGTGSILAGVNLGAPGLKSNASAPPRSSTSTRSYVANVPVTLETAMLAKNGPSPAFVRALQDLEQSRRSSADQARGRVIQQALWEATRDWNPQSAPAPRKDGLGSVSGRLADNAKYYSQQGGLYAPLSILNGMLVGPAALFDVVPQSIRRAAAESRTQIARSAAQSNDPVQRFMSRYVAAPLSHAGEFVAQGGNGVGAGAPLLAAGAVVPAIGAALTNRAFVGAVSGVELYTSTNDAISNYKNGTISGSDAAYVVASLLGLNYALDKIAPVQTYGGTYKSAESLVSWVDEGGNLRSGGNVGMSDAAYQFQSGTFGARTNAATGRTQAPYLEFRDRSGSLVSAKFDGVFGTELIDRKLFPYFTQKAVDQATRQVAVAEYYGLNVVWELPTQNAVNAANRFMISNGVNGITVRQGQ